MEEKIYKPNIDNRGIPPKGDDFMKNKELENWLKETKAKNLSRWELQQEIDLIIDRGFLVQIQGLNSYDKANYLFNQWQKEHEHECYFDESLLGEIVPENKITVVETEWQPKRGDRILVWDNEESSAEEKIFLVEIKGCKLPIRVVAPDEETKFLQGQIFSSSGYKHMKPLPIEQPKETDFKIQVIELIEENIEECKILTKAALKNQCYDTASKYHNKHEMCEELLIKIKQL